VAVNCGSEVWQSSVAAVKLVLEDDKLGCKPVNLGAHSRFVSLGSVGVLVASVLLFVILGVLHQTRVRLPLGAVCM
jgi:hypothetical protein